MWKNKTFYLVGLFLSTVVLGLSSCAKTQPTAAETLKQANQLLEMRQIDQAIAVLETYNTTHPGNRDILESLAFAYSGKPDPMLAAITFSQLAEQLPDQPEYFLYAAESMANGKDSAGAADFYRKYLELRPNEQAVWQKLAQQLEVANHGPEAINALLQAYKLKPEATIALRIGALFLLEENQAQAQKWYETTVTYGGEFAGDALLGLFELSMANHAYTEAEAIAAQLDKEHPLRLETSTLSGLRDELRAWRTKQNETLRIAREVALKEAEDKRKKEAEAAALLAQTPPAPDVLSDTPVVSIEAPATNSTDTTAPTETAPTPLPDTKMITTANVAADALGEARTLIQSGDYEAAAQKYRQSLANDDSPPLVWYELSQVYVALGDDRYAEAVALEARRRAPDDSRYLYNYLQIARRTLNQQRYFDELIKAHDKFPSDPDLTLILARAYLNLAQNRRNAALLYREFLTLAPDHPEAAAVRQELENF
ncbi:MAG: tetratricopeptide repeat protein [Verrucomicrobiota bacterium]|nr:tetratricopeptide repeat protein [Verrucomicrobiota bacterium]